MASMSGQIKTKKGRHQCQPSHSFAEIATNVSKILCAGLLTRCDRNDFRRTEQSCKKHDNHKHRHRDDRGIPNRTLRLPLNLKVVHIPKSPLLFPGIDSGGFLEHPIFRKAVAVSQAQKILDRHPKLQSSNAANA
jgi:hypothetical protein